MSSGRSGPPPWSLLGLLWLVLLLTITVGQAALAQTPMRQPQSVASAPSKQSPAAPPAFDPASALQQLGTLRNQLTNADTDRQLGALAAQAAAIEASASRSAASEAAALTQARHALEPIGRRRRLSDAEQQQRAMLQAQERALSGQLSQAQAVAAEAGNEFRQIAQRRRQGFAGRVLEHTASPLSPNFWEELAADQSDLARLAAVWIHLGAAVARAAGPKSAAGLLLGLACAVLAAGPVRRRLGRLGPGRRAAPAPSTVRISTAARTWTVAVDVGLIFLAAEGIRLSVLWSGLSDPEADQLLRAAVRSAVWFAAVVALGRALVADPDGRRRLVRVSDAQAARARAALWIIGSVTAAGTLLQAVIYVAGASVTSAIAVDCLVSLAYAAAAATVLFAFAAPAAPQAAPASRPAWSLIALALAGAIIGAVGSVLAGYSTLAALIAGQVFWLSLIAAVAFLLLRLIDELMAGMFGRRSRAASEVSGVFGLRLSTVLQAGVLAGAILQLMVIMAAIALALTPFGQSGNLLASHLRHLGSAIHIGKITLSPLAIAAGVATFAAGVALAHAARTWFNRRYLPVTDWDAGLRNSVSTGVAYLGVAAAVACALVVTGVSFSQIALVTSALSVGIGFGLQQVVQNFVAGVILLVERPIKVGDWVNVGGVEGDVINIRVRATDIRAFDCSRVIVPNANLITMNVQNKTAGHAQIRVQLPLGAVKPSDAVQARQSIEGVVAANAEVLKDPPPEVRIDGLGPGGGANLSCWFDLADPRQANRVKSDLYFELLDKLQAQGIAFL